jgi:hypothetical protein
MHLLMMSMYASITAIVLAAIEQKPESARERVMHGLKVFAAFMAIGLLLSWLLYPLPW